MAKRVTKAHKRHTKTGEGTANEPQATIKGTPAEWRQRFEEGNRLPETKLDALEKLAHSSEDAEHLSLRISLQQIRACLANGEARWAVCHALTAGVLAHGLGWSPEDADFGREALRNIEEKKEKQRARWPEYQAAVDAVRAEFPDMDKHSVKVTAAERCGVKWDTIHRRTEWL